MVYQIDWFVYIEESLHPNLIMVYDLFNMLLNCLLEFYYSFCIYVH